MASMHAMIYESKIRKSNVITAFQIVSAVITTALIFYTYSETLVDKSIWAGATLTSIISTILSFYVPKSLNTGSVEEYLRAISVCSTVKSRIESALCRNQELDLDEYNQLVDYIEKQFNTLPKIPDSKFNHLKYKHNRKVMFSRYLDDHSNYPYLLCKIRFILSSIKGRNNL